MATMSSSSRRDVETFLTEWLTDHRIPGAAVAVTNADETIYADGFGAKTLESNDPVTEQTLFGIGSCTKSFTAAAIMQLADETELSVTDPVEEYIPHLAEAPGEAITLRELLTHTSGVPSDGSAGPLITRPLGISGSEVPLSSEGDFRRHVQGAADRRVTDRETFFYYNSGYTMLGLVIEAVTGQSYASYIADNVLEPLGMTRSTFEKDAFETDDDRMTPYVKQDDDVVASEFPFDEFIHAPGGLVSSMDEMASYLRMYMNDGTVDGTTVLEPGTVEEMTTGENTFGAYLDGPPVEYGYGLMMEPFLDDEMIGHGGSIAVSNAWFGYLDEAELGVAIACTTSPEAHPMTVGPAVLAVMNGHSPADVVPHFQLVEALDAVTGSYESYRGLTTATVERNGGTLTFTQEADTGGQELHLFPDTIEDDLLICSTVTATGMSYPVRFELDGEAVDCFFERSRFTQV